ncbi:hypothetical protein MTO96_020955 [Rhipicephalus appendiculatus]
MNSAVLYTSARIMGHVYTGVAAEARYYGGLILALVNFTRTAEKDTRSPAQSRDRGGVVLHRLATGARVTAETTAGGHAAERQAAGEHRRCAMTAAALRATSLRGLKVEEGEINEQEKTRDNNKVR